MNNSESAEDVRIFPLGDSAIVLEFGADTGSATSQLIQAVCLFLDEYSFEGFIEYVPAFTTVTVFYDSLVSDYQTTRSLLLEMLEEIDEMEREEELVQIFEIPVLYGGDLGGDLSFVALHNGLTEEAVVALHTANEYEVNMISFMPGFPYLGGMDMRITATPKEESLKVSVLAGSVGISGMQTGIYPTDTQGGWRIIGQTPLNLFDLERERPSLLKAGNKIRFVAIDALEFDLLKGSDNGY